MNFIYELFGEGKDLSAGQMAARVVIVFLFGIVLVRIAGRRSFGVGEPFDNVMKIMLGAILSRAVVGASPFVPIVVASLTLVIMHWVFGKLSVYSTSFGSIIKGEVIVLYENGEMNRQNMKRCMISEKDLMEGIREGANTESLTEVKSVHLERNGKMSVIKN
ncbi:MAG: hypothetical protein JWO32_2305 [Bacteroidetes bacterium]|nr:hypothetical protein [Bacteroidota bacterium]